jgi:hypothetical protein
MPGSRAGTGPDAASASCSRGACLWRPCLCRARMTGRAPSAEAGETPRMLSVSGCASVVVSDHPPKNPGPGALARPGVSPLAGPRACGWLPRNRGAKPRPRLSIGPDKGRVLLVHSFRQGSQPAAASPAASPDTPANPRPSRANCERSSTPATDPAHPAFPRREAATSQPGHQPMWRPTCSRAAPVSSRDTGTMPLGGCPISSCGPLPPWIRTTDVSSPQTPE